MIGGGNVKISGFKERLAQEIDHRGLLNDMVDKCGIHNAEDESSDK